ncbi:hypothetical protein [Prosthecobacter sp.]|uniref:hypothetical protein n=1 Tax=Prosthecobacter sp. TaxID=1965333 RepID=UPI0037832433
MNWTKARWILAGIVLLVSVWLMSAGLKAGGIGAAFPVIGSALLFVTFIIMIAPDTAVKVSEWIARPFAALFYPDDEFDKPPLSYVLARKYSQERKVESAVQEYEKILYFYPEERDACRELIELGKRVGDGELTEKYEEVWRERFENESGQNDEMNKDQA